ncbi:hypothetical protein BG006_008520 [Podila minutissima]|uniref:Uncharacterized protein n=1 Tax=Podila minutissima TaxID=64525 RepID=A0A9P5VJJ3_9FUNG|nr:hypothetical protein BG006_008520 [Podila minutissima]
MVSNKTGAHDDDEPLLPLISDSGYSKQHQHTTVSSVKLKEISTSSTSHHHHHKEDDEILKSSSVSGSTAHESLPEVHDHHHDHSHGHSHNHSHNHSHTHGAHDHHHPVTGARTSTPNSIVSIESAEDDAPTLAEMQESEKDKRRLKIAIVLCSTFFCVELAGGLLADSLALLSDSFHLLTDITSFIISLAAIYLSHRPSTATHTFGYHRAEVLGALFSIFLIWGLTLLLVMEAYDRVRHPIDIDGKTMSIIAVLGVCVNVVLMFVLGGHHHHHGHSHGHGHDHGHGHSHDHGSSGHTDHTPLRSEEDHDHDDHDHDGSISHKPIAQHDHDHDHDHDHEHGHGHGHGSGGHHHHTNLNITAATLHVLGDLLSSVGVLISSLIITFYPSLTYLDPICTFIFSILVIATTAGVFKQSMAVLMERVPYGMNTEDVRETICDVPGVLEVKSLHVWSLTVGKVALTSTVFLQPEVQDLRKAYQILAVVRRSLKKKYGIRQSTIQMEMYAPDHHRVPEIGSHQHLNGAGGPSRSSDPFSDTLARHDQDIIFSIGDEDDDHHDNHNHSHGHSHSRSHDHGSHHHSHGHQRGPGTPLSSYRKNRADGEDESESEMEQEILVEPNRWA